MKPNFKPEMLTLARESRGLTQTEFSTITQIPQSILSKIEQGFRKITDDEIEVFSKELEYPKDFFYQKISIFPPNIYYRKKVSVPAKTLNKAEAVMNIYRANIHSLLKSVELPQKNFPVVTSDDADPIETARKLRSYWNIPKGAIENLTQLLESKGIIIILCDFETDKIDGRSMTTEDGHPIIFLNKGYSGDRLRLTLAHELGHLILHISNENIFDKSTEEKEIEAFNFASEFMMPSNEIISQLPLKIHLGTLADLKRYWKMSMQSILMHLKRCGNITDSQSRYLWFQIGSSGYRKKEPIEIPKEIPTLISELITVFLNELNYSNTEMSKLLCLVEAEFKEKYLLNTPKLRITR
jgi:Zn-dependent peptidase ImmA (M78 family)